MPKKELSLRVAEAFVEDVGKGFARVDTEELKSIRAVPGDLLMITGRGSTVARTAQATAEYSGQSLIQMDGVTRENADVSVDEWCTVRKASFKPAESILLSPMATASIIPKSSEIPHILQMLSGRYIVPGDKIQIALFGTRPQFFIVDGASPRGALLITPGTSISFKTPDFLHEKAARISYEDIGGLEKELSSVKEMIELPLKFPELFSELGIDPPKGVLLSGPPGTGKTLVARTISNEVRAHFIHVNGPEIIHKYYGESEAKLREVFEEARRNAPSIIFLDEIDALAPRRAKVIGDVEKRVVAQLLALMDGLVSRGDVVIIGATNLPELVDPALRRPGRFDREITIGVPNRSGRLQILKIHSRKMPLAADVNLDRLAEITHGYVGADIAALCKEAGMATLRRIMPEIKFDVGKRPVMKKGTTLEVTAEDFLTAFKGVEPTSTREFMVERPRLSFSDIGGLKEIKRELRSIVELPLQGLSLFADSRLGPPKGVLFSGPSGTGKTLMARSLAGEMGMTLIVVDPPTLLSKWVGESEKGLREVFKRAKQASPCILFFDEIETIASARSADDAGNVSQRMVSQLFRELDGLHGSLGVVVIGATNRIDLMEPALLRAGRFDYLIEFPLPDREERQEILETYLQSLPLDADVDVDLLADVSEGWTGADIEASCKRAIMLGLEDCSKSDGVSDFSRCVLTSDHFTEAARQHAVLSSISASVFKRKA
ncbi:MAG TPA: AAA family ATPase [Proteobacteria bacterium]|nr:ATP-dependent zinc metalloprotease FtsH [bacterium BMS3Abin14]HDL53583.1 AAA family ATPase [Pseudomonadota bacterium]